jgi:hypothetical protein
VLICAGVCAPSDCLEVQCCSRGRFRRGQADAGAQEPQGVGVSVEAQRCC